MSTNNLSILGHDIAPGQGAFIELEVAKLHTRNRLNISVIVERAKKDGPTLLLMGGVHGNEINGVAIVRDIIRKKYNIPKIGTIICIPIFNVFGYLHQTREFPDGRDLNRVFPGSAKGPLASQFAHKFTTEIAPLVDYVIDFHTGGAELDNFPNIRCAFSSSDSLELAKAFNPPFILNSNYIPKSVRYTVNKLGKTIILFEGGKSTSLNQKVIDEGVNGALNVMAHLGLRDPEPVSSHQPVIIESSKWLRAPLSGMYQPLVKNGSFVAKKTVLGKIMDPYGEFERLVKAPFDCHIFGLNTAPIVNKGDALFHVSVS